MGVRTLAFARTRKLTELVLGYAQEILRAQGDPAAARVCAYRGGYTKEERRGIEKRLFATGACDRLLGVVATSALELGVDIGELHRVFPISTTTGRDFPNKSPSSTLRDWWRLVCFLGSTGDFEESVLESQRD